MIGLRGPSAKGVRCADDQPAPAGEKEKKSPRQGTPGRGHRPAEYVER